MPANTFMKALYESVLNAVEAEPGRGQISGLSKENLVGAVKATTEALDSLPGTTSLHELYFALTYVRNGVMLAMEQNHKVLTESTGGST